MKTVKSKLFLYFMVGIVSFAVLSILLNLIFLEHFYMYKNKAIFLKTYNDIAAAYKQNPRGISDMINSIDRTEGISCIVADGNSLIQYSSFPMKQDKAYSKLPSELEQAAAAFRKGHEEYLYTTILVSDSNVRQIVFAGGLGNGDIVILRKPITWIVESAGIADEFLLYSGLAVILVGGIAIYLLARRITRPIKQMSDTARSIADMDFSKRVMVHSQDEIGNLGQSINDMAEKLNANMYALKQDVERRKTLVRNISHELKTPIGIVKGYTEGLKYGLAEDREKFNRYCGIIVSECDRMDGLIRELLEQSKLESGTYSLEITTFAVPGLIEGLLNKFIPILKEDGISYSVSCAPALEMTADRGLMERLLSNFLTNAMQHTEGEKVIRIDVLRQGDRIRLSVFNSGSPIGKDDLTKIWDVFYRADKARARGGHGLGLSIVKSIAELHGGTCGCENSGGGVWFYADIPNPTFFNT